ncbi:MAG: hypothetical protein AB1560_13435 [Pseudomonadota bacterium]
MKNLFNPFKKILLAALLALAVFLPAVAPADTPNYPIANPGLVVFTFQYDGQFTTTTAGVTRFAMPFKARVIGAQASCNTIGGSATPTNSVDINDDGTTILSADMGVDTADTVESGTIASPSIADESVITIDFTITGTSPTFDDCTVVLVVMRE